MGVVQAGYGWGSRVAAPPGAGGRPSKRRLQVMGRVLCATPSARGALRHRRTRLRGKLVAAVPPPRFCDLSRRQALARVGAIVPKHLRRQASALD